MRREYGIEQSYLKWLKEIGCILYSPFRDGTLLNYMDGEEWYNNTPNFATISLVDDGLQIVKTNTTQNCPCIQIDSVSRPNLTVGDIVSSQPLTLICTQKSSVNAGAYTTCFCDGGNTKNATNVGWQQQALYGHTIPYNKGLSNFPTAIHTYAGIMVAGGRTDYYLDNVYKSTDASNRTNALTEWNRNHFSCRLTNAGTYVVRDCYAFSTAISVSDLNKIYQHDQQ